MKIRRIISGIALAACFFQCGSAFSQADAGQQKISVEPPVIGPNAPQSENLPVQPPSDVKGWLLYTFDTSTYGPGGVPWPFSSYFVLKRIGNADAGKTFLSDLDTVSSFKVVPKNFAFILQPKLSPNDQYVIFKDGDRTSSFSSFSLRLYDLRARKLTTIELGDAVGYWPVSWSPNSRYVACLTGGFRFAFGPYVPPGLWVYDVQRQQSHLVIHNVNLIGNIAWTPQNTLLYSLPVMNYFKVFDFDPAGNRPAISLPLNASRPTPSPDGKWIAGLSFIKAKSKAASSNAGQTYLSLFSRKGGKSIVVVPIGDPRRTMLLWSADSSHLYRITRRYNSTTSMEVRFYEYALQSKSDKLIASFTNTDKDGLDEREEEPVFSPLQVSRDGHYLFFTLIQNTNKTQGGRLLYDEYLKALDLRTHLIKDICRIPQSGLDWQDASLPAPQVP